jgi:hypothetical protein
MTFDPEQETAPSRCAKIATEPLPSSTRKPKGGAVYLNVHSRLAKLKLSDDDRLSWKKLTCRPHPVLGSFAG